MARALRAWPINRRGKNSVSNLRYGPQTRLVRGMYTIICTIIFIYTVHYVYNVPLSLASSTDQAKVSLFTDPFFLSVDINVS